jgi:hypothetical protein
MATNVLGLFACFSNGHCSGLPALSCEEQKRDFYVKADGMRASDLAKAADEFLTAFDITEQVFADGGEYLPLSVWANRGFNADNIRDRSAPDDIREDKVLGTCYRVRIVSKVTNTRVGNNRSSRVSLQKPKLPALEDAPTPLALEDGTVESNIDSESSSDSSSSSSSRDRKKKKKKDKKSKRDRKSKKSKKERKHKNKVSIVFVFCLLSQRRAQPSTKLRDNP